MQEIDSLMKRKNMTVDTVKDLLAKFYNARSRQMLDDAALVDFRDRVSIWQGQQ